jgi:hypothetical protein
MATRTKKTTRKPVRRGNMTPAEIRPLIMAAREAYAYQDALGNIAADFDTWRHSQVIEAVGRSGLTACDHQHFQPLLGHFQALAGRDDQAFQAFVEPDEERKHLAHQIVAAVEDHQAAGGDIGLGYVVHLARQATRRPRLSLGRDLRRSLAERCDARQLTRIRNTVTNRIAAKDGRGDTRSRNKSQRNR